MNEIIGAALFNFYSFYKVLRSLRKGNAVFLKALWGLNSLHIKRRKKKRPSIFTLLFP